VRLLDDHARVSADRRRKQRLRSSREDD
jgi:hypothetical protein